MPRERATERRGPGRNEGTREKVEEHLSFLWKSIEESSESASPGQRLCHLIGYVEQFILFFPIPCAGRGAREEGGGERTREREVRMPKERQRGAPSSTYLLPSAHVDAIFQYRVKRALPFSFIPLPFLPLTPPSPSLLRPSSLVPPIFLSFRLAPSFLSREGRENGSEARNEKKGRKESRWAAREVKKVEEKRKSEEPRLASAATREPSKVE